METLTMERTFEASREKVFKAWTDPTLLQKWFSPATDWTTPKVETDLKAGGKYRITMKAPDGRLSVVIGTYKEVNPPERLVFTWMWENEKEETLVTVKLTEKNGATQMLLTHELFSSKEIRDQHEWGWKGAFENLNHVEMKGVRS